MTATLFTDLAIFVLSLLVGFEVISKIPSMLHTPMMSGANAVHGAVVAGAIVVASLANSPVGYALAFVAAAFGAANVVGGYVVTDRMLQMFRRPEPAPTPAPSPAETAAAAGSPSGTLTPGHIS